MRFFYQNLSNFYLQDEQVLLAEELLKSTSMDKVFFTNSGTESVETALKICYKKIGLENRKKSKIVAFKNSFHGRTLGSLSITLQDKYRKFFIETKIRLFL